MLLGRSGFSDMPTTAILRNEVRISFMVVESMMSIKRLQVIINVLFFAKYPYRRIETM